VTGGLEAFGVAPAAGRDALPETLRFASLALPTKLEQRIVPQVTSASGDVGLTN